jgi:hypothetical protein
MPILGIMASSRPAFELVGSYDSLAAVTIGTAVSSITFAGIPSGYKHLQIRALTLTTTASNGALLEFNGDTTSSNYRTHFVYGSGSGSGVASNGTSIYTPNFQGATSSPGSAMIDILDYSNTNKNKVVRCLDGYDANGSGYIGFTSGLWLSTAAITSIKFSSTNFQPNAQFALYGIK